MKCEVAVIGGGAAGLVCGGMLARSGKNTVIIERNSRPGRKLLITGKGRCNITNLSDNNELIGAVTKNQRFLYSAFSAFSAYDTVDFIESLGVKTKVERGNRVFPVSDKAVDVVDALNDFAVDNGAEFVCGRAVDFEFSDGKITAVVLENGDIVECEYAVICTGGLSYPRTGSTGDGYELAKKCGHQIVPQIPSLVPLNVMEGAAAQMQGLSLKNIKIRVEDAVDKKTVFEDFGEMIFTHFGLSGPVILSASAHMRNMERGRYKVHIDLKPALDSDKLDARILRDFAENPNKDFANSLGKLLPLKMISVIIKLSKIPFDIKVNQITRAQRQVLCALLKDFCFTVSSFRPVEEAIVTSGGVSCDEIDPKTMCSRLVNNLRFAGEVIDVDAYTGGFNLQIAFSTACAAANNIF